MDSATMPTTTAPFQWKLDPKVFKKSIFANKKLNEFVDLGLVIGFLKDKMGAKLDVSNIPRNKREKFLRDQGFTSEFEQIKGYRQLYNANESFTTKTYLPKHKWGRVIAEKNLSLSAFCRATRHSMAKDTYVDIDMVNSSPSIFCRVAEQNGVEVPHLNEYISDHKTWRKKIMEHHGLAVEDTATTKEKTDMKNKAKQLPITITYGGSYDTWLREENVTVNADSKMELFVGMQKEIQIIREIVWAENQHIFNDIIKADPKKWNGNGYEAKMGLMGIWCFTIERYLEESAVSFISETYGYPIVNIVPCQDGFMIPKSDGVDYEKMCVEIADLMITKCRLGVRFEVKAMDEAYEIKPATQEKTLFEWQDTLSTRLLADRLIEEHQNEILVTSQSSGTGETLTVFVFSGGKWHQESDKFYNLAEIISKKLFETVAEEIRIDDYLSEDDKNGLIATLRKQTSKGGSTADIIRLMIGSIPKSSQEFDANPFLLGFNNGVFDLKNHEFREYRFDDFVTMTTGYDFEDPRFDTDEEDRETQETIISIIDSIQPNKESMNLLLQILASGLDGFGHQKLNLFNGKGGNGKGFIGGIMAKVLGDYYYQPSNSMITEIAASSTSASPDICSLKNKRYVNFQEVKGRLNMAFLKQLTGGGRFRGRMLHQNPIEFGMTWTTVMEFNEAPKLTDAPEDAEERRCIDLDFPTIFTTDETKIDKEINGVFYRRANPMYVSESFLLKARKVFLHMLLNVYKRFKNDDCGMVFTIPQHIIDRTKRFLKNQDIFHQLLTQRFEICDETETVAPIKLKDVWRVVSELDDYTSMTKAEKRTFNYAKFGDWFASNIKVQAAANTVYYAHRLRALDVVEA